MRRTCTTEPSALLPRNMNLPRSLLCRLPIVRFFRGCLKSREKAAAVWRAANFVADFIPTYNAQHFPQHLRARTRKSAKKRKSHGQATQIIFEHLKVAPKVRARLSLHEIVDGMPEGRAKSWDFAESRPSFRTSICECSVPATAYRLCFRGLSQIFMSPLAIVALNSARFRVSSFLFESALLAYLLLVHGSSQACRPKTN